MIRFSKSGVAVITVAYIPTVAEIDNLVDTFEGNDTQFHKAELVIEARDRCVETSDYHYQRSGVIGTKWRDFRTDYPALKEIRKRIPIIIKLGSWYFSISKFYDIGEDWDGYGTWYSGDMLRRGWGFHVG